MSKTKTFYYWGLGFVFALAVVLRIVSFSYRDSYEDDECRLLLAYLDKSWLQMFLSLGKDAQSAPPLFIILQRFWGCIFGFGEKSLHFLTLLISFGSIYFFYKLSTEVLTKKYTILIANLLFAINLKLIFFSSLVKQYTLDVLVGLICALVFSKIDLVKLSKIKLLYLTLFLILLPFISLPSLFFIGTFVLINLIKNYNSKAFYLRSIAMLLPFFIILLLYYKFNLLPSKNYLDTLFPNYWDNGFMELSWLGFIKLSSRFFAYIFYPNNLLLMIFILISFGLYYGFREGKNVSRILFFVIAFALLASVLKLYPIWSRTALYLVPILILYCLKPLEVFKIKSWQTCFFLLIFILAFSKYNLTFSKELLQEKSYITYSPKMFMQTLAEEYNPKTDIIYCNLASVSSYLFYSSFYKFDSEEVFDLPFHLGMSSDEIKDFLESLPSNKTYWFYLIKDYPETKIFPELIEWLNTQSILYFKQHRESYLIKIKRL